MKKWLTSNYHYMVPECDGSLMKPDWSAFLTDVRRGIQHLGADCATPVVIGPVTMAYLTRMCATDNDNEDEKKKQCLVLLDKLIPLYEKVLEEVVALGIKEIQIHEAVLVMEDKELLPLFRKAYPKIIQSPKKKGVDINMVSYMEDIGEEHYQWIITVPEITILSMDFTRGESLKLIQSYGFPKETTLGAGLIDSRSVWCLDPNTVQPIMKELAQHVAKIRFQPSASLQFVPWDLQCETEILKHPAGPVLSFAIQKLEEVVMLSKAFNDTSFLKDHASAWEAYRNAVSKNTTVSNRIKNLTETDFQRSDPFEKRRPKQLEGAPMLPTTTIGSFPQTKAIRQLRSKHKKGLLSEDEYKKAIDQQIAYAIGVQEALGLDILVHGEAERTDMVEFFAQKMDGMLFTTNGWVQSFGSRCVRPPIFWSDISRPHPMTLREFSVAQKLTDKPVKGMLTGPVTILNWSFPRADVSRKEQAFQIALSIRDEIKDLEEAGCKVIQVDEPALREAMPMHEGKKQEYLDWTVDSFLLATAGASSSTQIHTHMCYCEFADCMHAIDRMDTDVNSIENARSDNATLLAFKKLGYTKDLGPGTYDIHSPVVPTVDSIAEKLKSFLGCVEPKRLVVNPDCGLKTRTWTETIGALKNMVQATEQVRSEMKVKG